MAFASCHCHNGNHIHAFVQEHVHRVYTIILGVQFISMSMCMRARFGVYVTDMHNCLCKLLCMCLMCTQVLCMRASTSSILHTHACVYMSEIKNMSCQVHPHVCLVKFKLSSTIHMLLRWRDTIKAYVIRVNGLCNKFYHIHTHAACFNICAQFVDTQRAN